METHGYKCIHSRGVCGLGAILMMVIVLPRAAFQGQGTQESHREDILVSWR